MNALALNEVATAPLTELKFTAVVNALALNEIATAPLTEFNCEAAYAALALSVVAIEALNAIWEAALAENEVATDELKLPVTLATDELNAEIWYADELSVVAIEELKFVMVVATLALKSDVVWLLAEIEVATDALNPPNANTASYVEALKAVTLAALALNEVATEELKLPVTLWILALLALNEVATDCENVLMLPVKSGVVLPSAPNKNKVLLLLA